MSPHSLVAIFGGLLLAVAPQAGAIPFCDRFPDAAICDSPDPLEDPPVDPCELDPASCEPDPCEMVPAACEPDPCELDPASCEPDPEPLDH